MTKDRQSEHSSIFPLENTLKTNRNANISLLSHFLANHNSYNFKIILAFAAILNPTRLSSTSTWAIISILAVSVPLSDNSEFFLSLSFI